MKRKIFSVLFALVLVLSFSLVTAVPVAAATDRLVPSVYATIQAAINAAVDGDTIIVSDGTYTQDLTVNTPNLTLKSVNGSGSTTIQGVTTNWAITLQAGSSGFTLGGAAGDGFTVVGSGSTTKVLLGTVNGPSGVTLSYNVFDTTGETNMAIAVGAGGAANLNISHNTLELYKDTSGQITGIYFDTGDVTNLVIDTNTFNRQTGVPKWLLWAGNAHVDGATISNNIITRANVAIRMFSRTNLFENVTFSGNTIDGGYIAIGNGNNASGDGVITSLSIFGNSFTGPAYEEVFFEILGPGGGVDAADIDWSTLTVNFNNFAAAAGDYAIKNGIATTLNAENNWWDDASGPSTSPGTGDKVSANVDYDPWLGAPLELPAVHHETLGTGTFTVDASDEADTTVTLTTTGPTEIYVARYESQPFPDEPFPELALGKYIDIHVSNPGNVVWPIRVEVTYTDAEVAAAGIDEGSLGLYYYEGIDTFHRCSDTGVNPVQNFIWANVTEEEAGYLVGTPFGPGGSPPPVAVGGEFYPINKVSVLALWLGLALILAIGGGILVMRRRRAD